MFFERLSKRLDEIEKRDMEGLDDISKVLLAEKSGILGDLTLGLIERKYSDLLNQEYHTCEACDHQLKNKGLRKRQIDTLVASFTLYRPYFYCNKCRIGYFPLDDVLGLSESSKQYDVQDVGAWLASEMPYEMAGETYERITGEKLSERQIHEVTNAIGSQIDILDVCPSSTEIEKAIEKASSGKRCRPVLMIAIDGAHGPMRPEPTPHRRDEKRGKGEWKEIKGFRVYLIDSKRMLHLISWHQVGSDQDLARSLEAVKDAGLIPEDNVRIGIIGDGAPWIWNRARELFPNAKEILDYYHCSEHVHKAANTYFGKSTKEAQEWAEGILTRLYFGMSIEVIADLQGMKSKSEDADEQMNGLATYISNNGEKINYDSAKRGGYHIGSGAIESANKFISNTRLKRSGAWWYIQNANNILKIRCAKYNGTYDKVINKYRIDDQKKIIENKKNKVNLSIVP